MEVTVQQLNISFLIGAYIFKAYSNGHPFDTSQVTWGSKLELGNQVFMKYIEYPLQIFGDYINYAYV